MTNLEIAQKIAEQIDTHTQDEIWNMMDVICHIHDISPSWLNPVVGNLYAKMTPSVMNSSEKINQGVDFNND